MEKNNIKEIFIPLNTPSSKNGKQWTGSFLTSSPATHKWRRLTKDFWTENKDKFLEMTEGLSYPLHLEFTFIRGSRRKFDYPNPLQTILDEMKRYEWIPDDNVTIIKPYFGDYEYSKQKPGCKIRIIKNVKYEYI